MRDNFSDLLFACVTHPAKLLYLDQAQSDWPGLAPAMLHEGRDLRPTVRFETLVSDALSDHFRLDPAIARRTMFPDFV